METDILMFCFHTTLFVFYLYIGAIVAALVSRFYKPYNNNIEVIITLLCWPMVAILLVFYKLYKYFMVKDLKDFFNQFSK